MRFLNTKINCKYRIYVCLLISALFTCFVATGCSSDTSSSKSAKVYGTISVSGSSTMTNLMSIWCKDYSDIYNNTNCIVESFGSGRAPQDLIEGSVDIGMMSEPMSSEDKRAFKNTYGYEPLEIKIAINMIAVLVNTENPIDCLTIDQIDGIYSNTYKCQGSSDISAWGILNQIGEWSNMPIKIYSRTPTSGTYNIFKNIALCGGTYKNTITKLASSRDIGEFVSQDIYSIGYSGTGLQTPNVKAVGVGKTKDKCYLPESNNAVSKDYPLTRDLYLYFRESPSKGMKNVTTNFLEYVFSKQGQDAIKEAGLVKLPKSILQEQREKTTN